MITTRLVSTIFYVVAAVAFAVAIIGIKGPLELLGLLLVSIGLVFGSL